MLSFSILTYEVSKKNHPHRRQGFPYFSFFSPDSCLISACLCLTLLTRVQKVDNIFVLRINSPLPLNQQLCIMGPLMVEKSADGNCVFLSKTQFWEFYKYSLFKFESLLRKTGFHVIIIRYLMFKNENFTFLSLCGKGTNYYYIMEGMKTKSTFCILGKGTSAPC